MIDDIFVGEQATINWTTVGLNKKEVNAQIKRFELKVTSPNFVFPGAKLKYKNVFDLPIPGEVAFKPEKTNSIGAMKYPKFSSAGNNVSAPGLAGKYSYFKGGFTLAGKNISSISKYSSTSTFKIEDSGGRKLKIVSQKMVFADSTLVTNNANLVIYTKFDSIYHPAVRIRYDAKTNTLIAQKDMGSFRNTPYVSSANKMSFTADLVSWNLDQDNVYFSTLLARHEVPLIFQSNEYYDRNTFSDLTGLYNFNPLKLVLAYAEKEGVRDFNLGDLADDKKINVKILQSAMIGLYQRGYIEYDKLSDRVTITEKGWHKGQAQKGKADYDSVLLLSLVNKGSNAIFNLRTQEIKIKGVDKFYLAKVLDVSVEADSNQITILENRDIKFNGRLAAGNFDYVGRDFIFRYDSFLVEMQQIDAIEMYVLEESKSGPIRTKVNNSLSGIPKGGLKKPEKPAPPTVADSTAFDQTTPEPEPNVPGPAVAVSAMSGTSGILYISKPKNKSGKKLIPNFPKFKGGGTGSVVYFDKPEILSGVYDRSLYFTLPPFDLDSLSDSDPAAIKFTGTFHSDSWFPDFTEKLHIMP
ncbi:MAG: hypothetical protein KAI17_19315, partial [Thiotrichaceae bacterium]|nr:hypothetical protein [Thiotrichaceae bacterium]